MDTNGHEFSERPWGFISAFDLCLFVSIRGQKTARPAWRWFCSDTVQSV